MRDPAKAFLAIASSLIAASAFAQPAPLQRLELEQPFVTRVRTGPGEMAVAMAADGRRVVVGINALRGDVAGQSDTIFFSDDGGRTFLPSAFNPNSRDPAVAFGPSGRVFHVSFRGQGFRLAGSDDGGATFAALAGPMQIGNCVPDAATATAPAATTCGVDQPHMAVDPRPGASGDRVYVVWRETDTFPVPNAVQTTTVETPMIQASCDGGVTVLPPQPIGQAILAPNGLRQSDFLPRVAVGADGKVYAVFVDQRQASPDEILLQRFSACDDPGGFLSEITNLGATEPGRLVAVFNNIPCGAAQGRPAGLDRCNDGNILTGPTVAIDANAPNRIAVTFAHNVSPTLDEIRVAMSDDRGGTFPGAAIVALNSGGDARRFLPWSCGGTGQLFAGWYDRRNARADANDLTQYFVRAFQILPRAAGDTAPSMRRFPERDVTQGLVDDQCLTWPLAPRSSRDSDSCSAQPQFAGVCTLALPAPNVCAAAAPCPTGARCQGGVCDFGCNADADCIGRPGDSAADPLVCEAATCVLTSRQASVRCDFSDELAAAGPKRCVAGESCQVGAGATKYGDYNGIACTGDSAIVAWASHVPPPGVFEPIAIAVNVARIEARSLRVELSVCARNPDLCVGPERLIPGGIDLRCDRPACIVVDSIPENCKFKFDCPGCRPGELCPPDYRLTLDDPGPGWTVELTDARGRRAPHRRTQAGGRITLAIRPDKSAFIPGAIGDYRLLFRMTDKGEVGKRYHVKMTLDRD